MIKGMFIGLAILILLSVPIGVVLQISTVIPYLMDNTFVVGPEYIFRNLVMAFNSYTLIAIPLFIFAGVLMARGQISKKIYEVFVYFIGDKTGGLPSAVVITCLFYGAISGSGPATTAAVGSMTLPLLTSLGYDVVFSAALVGIAGGLGIIIPPSIPFIMYSDSSGSSVGDMFIAGILPGCLIAALLVGYVIIYFKKHGEDTEKINKAVSKLRSKGFLNVFKDSFWALLSPLIVLGGIYSGTVTPTEAACISVVYSFIISVFVYKTIKIKDIIPALIDSARTLSPAIVITGSAAIFAKAMILLRIPQIVVAFFTSITSSSIIIILLINFILLVAGCLIDTGAAVLILTPILLPIAEAIGMEPIHFGVMMIVNLSIGFVTPPVGMNLFVAASLVKKDMMVISKQAIPFIFVFIIALLIITFVPQVSLLLVR